MIEHHDDHPQWRITSGGNENRRSRVTRLPGDQAEKERQGERMSKEKAILASR